MWHEARRSEKKVHDMMDAARKRAQRRAVYLAKRRGDPQQSIQVVGSRCRTYRDDGLYQATQDQQGLIPWNGKEDILIDRFDGRALLDFIRDSSSRRFRAPEKTEEEEELEEFVNFERYRDLIKHQLGDEEGLQHVNQEMEAKAAALFGSDSATLVALPSASEVAKEEEKRQKEVVKGDPSIRKLTRKERRKVSQIEREREREAAQVTGTRLLHRDPYRSRSRSRSHSPSHSRRYARGVHSNDGHRSKSKPSKIEYITEFAGSADGDEPKLEGFSPPPSPSKADVLSSIMLPEAIICGLEYMKPRPVTGQILEALHTDPASSVSLDKEKNTKVLPQMSTSSALARLSKTTTSGGVSKQEEKKETPQERLKRIMSRQLNKQSIPCSMCILVVKQPGIKKDTAVEMAKKKEQERQRNEKLAETSRLSRHRRRSHSRSYSRSPPRPHRDRVLLHDLRRVAQASIMASCRHEIMPFLLLEEVGGAEVQVEAVLEDIILGLVLPPIPVPFHALALPG
ncbi:hypothetical protein C3L33_01245, partial [Rhododendron williamsianum]